jgi:hypothetical protein
MLSFYATAVKNLYNILVMYRPAAKAESLPNEAYLGEGRGQGSTLPKQHKRPLTK